MNNPDLEDWNRIAETYGSIAGSPADYISTLFRDPLRESLAPVEGLRILDVGCGSGWLAAELQAQGAEVVGIDGSAKLLSSARTAHPELPFIQHDLSLGLPNLDGEFDRVVAHMVVMDIDPLAPLLLDIRRALGREGRLALTMPHPCYFDFPTSNDPETGEWSRKITRYLEPEVWRIPTYGGHNHYHRSLTYYFDLLRSNGFAVSRLFEPVQPKRPGDAAEQVFRRSIPVFLFLEAVIGSRGPLLAD